ncbi:unnamed protein product [Rotaria sp. Silwood2]|nr:unnamed protein product [Rotaria sp. Silwood2]CAF3191721.1 unnamed protein product [Rotaria sp. Silwood2]CAF3340201.1 unnamed protein product [Rotaria sp. Silwood2]CAF4420639.1 unnamed protein product [Rotaria sp. Silwood2]CAF4578043.1 unnamed protein product [Rotaria sp. Silwood2]
MWRSTQLKLDVMWNNHKFSADCPVPLSENEVYILPLILTLLLMILEPQDIASENEVEDKIEVGNQVEHTV